MTLLALHTNRLRTWLLGFALVWMSAEVAEGQMFGNRQVGRTLAPRARPGSAADAGTVRNQRFVRGNRGAGAFVGADRMDASRFVGTQQAGIGATVRSAVAGIQAAGDESNQVNRPARRVAANEPYAPRLSVAFDYSAEPTEQLAAQIERRLRNRGLPIEVSVGDRIAILRGVVISEEQRQLAELLVGFEAGISSVRNELTVDPSATSEWMTTPNWMEPDLQETPLPPPPPEPMWDRASDGLPAAPLPPTIPSPEGQPNDE